MQENGNISIHTENIFPIIKKWLYSDKDIFLRELVSNGCDAISKYNKLVSLGEVAKTSDEGFLICVILDKQAKTIKIVDNGLGMTGDEVKKYINQVAFSGAEEFLKKYKDEKDEENKIIGHFGLGFYSAFMVADEVEIETLSYIIGSDPVLWKCMGGTEYEMNVGTKMERGTTIILHISDASAEFLEEVKVREILNKYCSFLPYEIYLENAEIKDEVKEKDENKDKEQDAPKPINDIAPLWTKKPSDCTDEEYLDFYRKVFMDFNPPLFWIHLNVEYPFKLQGILYFPKLKNQFENMEGQIKLYNNQVFVADNIKEVIPEFLLLLKGAIDCPDLPLNVSRSFLQNDGYVRKVSTHITKKVADKIVEIFKNDREAYNKYWEDINPFVKFGCLRDEKFYEKVKEAVIFKTIEGSYITLNELSEQNNEKTFYVSDEVQQAQYVNMFKNEGISAILLNNVIDNHFLTFIESKVKDLKFARIDSDISGHLKEESDTKDDEEIKKLFGNMLSVENLKIEVQSLKSNSIPAIILLSEESRRMQEMYKMFGQFDLGNQFKNEQTLVINNNNPLVLKLLEISNMESVKMICKQIYDLAMISHKPLEPNEMMIFIERSNEILSKVANI